MHTSNALSLSTPFPRYISDSVPLA